jgi:DNA repair exonuclease SbcCD ATPase subunit
MSSFSSSSGGNNNNNNNNNMGPPPNQQPRQNPPRGGNGQQHRKSSSLNRGWFEGTMDVISGMAPRPVTPSQNSAHPSSSSSQSMRPASAPNSPARGMGLGLFGGGGGGNNNNNNTHGRGSPHFNHPFPPIDRTNSGGSVGGGSFSIPSFPGGSINRLPSQDSLDRSIHNESGHGKSTAQIIRDLKHSNSALSAKMASLEKRHMNDLAEVEGSAAARRKDLEQTNAKQRMKLMQYEQYKTAAESKLKQQDGDLSKVKEESAFQRHTISDLKNQLFQLQEELDERDEEDEIEEQQRQLNKGGGVNDDGDDDDDDHDHDEDSLRRPHSDDGHNLPRHPHHSRGGGLVIATSSSMSTEELQQLTLDNEELVKEIQELQDQLMEYQGYDKKLKDLQQKLEVAQKNSSNGNPLRPTTPTHPLLKRQQDRERPPLAPSTSRDGDDSDHYRQQLQDAKGELESQNQKLLQHESSVRDLEVERESLEEAHDLRVRELEERFIEVEEEWKRREIDLRTELASASNSQIDVDGIETRIREEQKEHLVELEEQLEQYAEKLAEVAATLAESRQQAKNQEQYRKDEAEDLRMIQDANESEIVRLEKELDEATRELELRDEELEETKQKYLSLLQRQEKEDEKKVEDKSDAVERTKSLDVNSGDGEATTATSGADDSRRVADLEEQLYNSVDTVNKLELQFEDLQKERDETIATLESDKAELLCDLNNAMGVQNKDQDPEFSDLRRRLEEKTSKSQEVESLKNEIESMRQRVHESAEAEKEAVEKVKQLEKQLKIHHIEEVKDLKEEITILNQKINELESLSTGEAQKKLQESQIALDDEKQKEKETMEEMKALLERKDGELGELQKITSRVGHLESEKLRLEDEVEQLRADQKRAIDDVQGTSRSIPSNVDVEAIRQSFEGKIENLNEEKRLIQTKLKDRDMTIATLLRSSIVLENKIESLEVEVEEYRASREKIEAELNKLRTDTNNRNEEYKNVTEEMRYTKGQLKVAKADTKRWKRSLKEDGTSSSEYRYHISTLQKANEEFAETIQERDQAIQNLVNQSMGQE